MLRKQLIPTMCVTFIVMLAFTVSPRAPQHVQARSATQQLEPGGITIPYTNQLGDDTGQPVDGSYDLIFALYPTEAGGESLWKEMQLGVPVRQGNFAVLLGNINLISKDVMDYGELWLAVEVRPSEAQTFVALNPRQQLSATSPDSPTSLSCEHTHFGEEWTGSSGSAGLVVDNRTGTGDGIRGYANSASADYGGVYGVNFAAGPGVYGRSDGGGPGVAGYSSGRGVYGSGADGVVGESAVNGMSGVYGNNTATTGYGMTGRSNNYFGVYAWGNDSSAFDTTGDLLLAGNYGEIFTYGNLLNLYSNGNVIIDLDDDNNTAGAFFRILSGSDGILWTVSETMGVIASGRQASVVQTADQGERLLYSIEGTGIWIEDIGTAALTKGEKTISFEPVFVQTVNLQQSYQVFVTPISQEPVWLYVTTKTAAGFTVRGVTLDGEPANCTFDYRVVAERIGYEDVRLESYTTTAAGGVK